MSKQAGRKTNFRVIVEPRGMGNFGSVSAGVWLFYNLREKAEVSRLERDEQDRCDEIAKEIKRHVDNVSYCAVEYDQEHVCEHCGSVWTEEGSLYNGGCCQNDEAAEEARAAIAKATGDAA